MTDDHDDELLKTFDSNRARVLAVDRDKVYRLIHGGVLPARKYGRTFRLRRGDVEGVAGQLRTQQEKRERKPWGPATARRTLRCSHRVRSHDTRAGTARHRRLAEILADYLTRTGAVLGEPPDVDSRPDD